MRTYNLEAKLKSVMISDVAGELYRPPQSSFIRKLNERGILALFGIESKRGFYTLVGQRFTYYRCRSREGRVAHDILLEILIANARNIGKQESKRYRFVKINNEDTIWFENGRIMTALWSVIMALDRFNKGGG